MPLNDFFSYSITASDSGHVKAQISFDASHRIYDGHFPGNPVTPGVVLLEIMRQILGAHVGKDLMLSSAKDIKFTNPVIPTQNNEMILEINFEDAEDEITVNAVFSGEEVVFTKIRGRYCEV